MWLFMAVFPLVHELEAEMSDCLEGSNSQSHLTLIRRIWWSWLKEVLGGRRRLCSVIVFGLLLSEMKLSGLLVFLVFCAQRSGASDRKGSCKYPPSQWCRSLKTAIECRVSAPRINSLELSSPKLRIVTLWVAFTSQNTTKRCCFNRKLKHFEQEL